LLRVREAPLPLVEWKNGLSGRGDLSRRSFAEGGSPEIRRSSKIPILRDGSKPWKKGAKNFQWLEKNRK